MPYRSIAVAGATALVRRAGARRRRGGGGEEAAQARRARRVQQLGGDGRPRRPAHVQAAQAAQRRARTRRRGSRRSRPIRRRSSTTTRSARSSARATTSTSTTASSRATAASSSSPGRASPTSWRSTSARTRSAGARTSTATAPTTWRSPPTASGCSSPPRRRGVVDVLDTRSGAILGRIASGDSPHESNFSRDGSTIFHASIGTVYTDTDDPAQDATKGERVFEIIDAETLEVTKRIDMGAKMAEFGRPGMSSAVRPMAISPDERFVYFQLSFFHGFAEYDLRADRITRVIDLPLSAGLRGHAAHGVRARLRPPRAGDEPEGHEAVRGRDDVGLRGDRAARTARRCSGSSASGRTPYWSASSEDGRYCFVSVAGDDRVSVISFKTGARGRADQGRRPPAADADRPGAAQGAALTVAAGRAVPRSGESAPRGAVSTYAVESAPCSAAAMASAT